MVLPFGMGCHSIQHTGKTGGIVTDINHFLNLTQTFLKYFPHFIGNQPSKCLFLFPYRKPNLTNISPR